MQAVVQRREMYNGRERECMAGRSLSEENLLIQQYVDALKSGDASAFESIFQIYKDRVYSMALYICKDASIAEDLTQAAFIKVMRGIHLYRGDSEFATWLYRIVFNVFLDYRRKDRSFVALEEAGVVMTVSATQQHDLIEQEIAFGIRKAIMTLPMHLSAPLLLRYMGGLSYEKIAKTLNISLGTVASRLARGHEMLAKKLKHLRGRS